MKKKLKYIVYTQMNKLGLKGEFDNAKDAIKWAKENVYICLLYTSPSPRDLSTSRMPSSA